MNNFEKWYLGTAEEIIKTGVSVKDRTGTGTISTFSTNYTHNLLEEPFPILSVRKMNFIQPIIEMIGFMNGVTNSEWFNERGCPFWNGFGLPEDVVEKKRKEDYELADEYCSKKGEYNPYEEEYTSRYAKLNSLSYEAGLKLITNAGVNLYKENVIAKKGDLGPIYGAMWRNWPNPKGGSFDQLKYAFEELKLRPYNRRIIVNGWNPSFMPEFDKKPHENVVEGNMSLTPCHVLHEYHTSPIPFIERVKLIHEYANENQSCEWEIATNRDYPEETLHDLMDDFGVPRYYLDLFWFQRSWDFILGAPANIAGYTAMLMMMAKLQNMIPRNVSVSAVNVHIYNNHIEPFNILLERSLLGLIPDCKPKLIIDSKGIDFIDRFKPENFKLEGYEHLGHVKFPISI